MDKILKCPKCKYYNAPVCTFHKWLPMTSRDGFCHHGKEGKYAGERYGIISWIRRRIEYEKIHRYAELCRKDR